MPKLNSAAMKKILTEKKSVKLENGSSIELQASGVIWNGNILTDVKEVPSDDEINASERSTEIERARRAAMLR